VIYIALGAGLGLMVASGAVIWNVVTRQATYRSQFACERNKLENRQILFTALLIIGALVTGGAAEHLL
jgi:hypothetical protein